MKASVFVGLSVDGFLARRDGSYDFLTEGGGDVGSNGFDEFIATVDAIVIGRKTFEVVLGVSGWFYGTRRLVVLSSSPVDLAEARARGGVVEQMSGAPEEIVSRLEADGAKHLYIDGGITVQRFLRAGLIDRMVLTRVPVLIGDGIPLFGAIDQDIRLRHVSTRVLGNAMVQTEYEVVK